MQVFTGILIFVMCWWVIWFMVLPFGVTTQQEEGGVVEGTVHSAPAKPRIVLKLAVTTVIAALVWGVIFYLLQTS